MGASLETKIAQAEKANAILDAMDENGDVDVPKQPEGTVKVQLSDIVGVDIPLPSSEMSAKIDEIQLKGMEDAPKVEALSEGFMFTAATPMAGDEPFYITVHLVGQDQYAVSANKNGVLTREDIKVLRKSLKSVMNEEAEQFNVGKKAKKQNDMYAEDDAYENDYAPEDEGF